MSHAPVAALMEIRPQNRVPPVVDTEKYESNRGFSQLNVLVFNVKELAMLSITLAAAATDLDE